MDLDPLPTVDVRTRLESATSVLESPNIVQGEAEAKRERKLSGTVCGTPEEK